MPGIVINSNFDLNQGVPIDSRLVATNSTVRNAILYKYDGLKVYQTDNKKTYLWNGTQWNVEGSGIYGGSGSLLGDTLVNFGTVSSSISSDSYELNFGVDYTGGSNCKSRIINKFIRHSTGITRFEYQGVEYRQQLVYINDTGNQINSSYVGYNSLSPNGIFGDLTFNTGDNSVSEKMRITGDGKIGIRTNDPKEYLQIGSTTDSSMPITFHKGGTTVIGYNWYYDAGDQIFNSTKGSSQIRQSDGEIIFQHRKANDNADAFVKSLYLSDSGNVGINTSSPTYTLDVNGNVRANNAIINSNLTASNIFVDNLRFWYNNNNLLVPFEITGNNLSLSMVNNNGDPYIELDSYNQRVNLKKFKSLSDSQVDGSLTVGTNIVSNFGNITNYEDPTLLTPNSTIYWSKNANYTGGSNGGTYPLSSFTYSFYFYRVGALVHLDYTIKHLGTLNYNGTENFYGWLIKFDNARFKPTSFSVGSGLGGFSGNGMKVPILSGVFVNDGSSNNPSLTSNEFYLKISTFKGMIDNPTKQGGDFIGAQLTNLSFKGSISYIASLNPLSNASIPDLAIDLGNSGNQN